MIIKAISSLIKMRKSLESGTGVFLSHKELMELYESNSQLPWDAIDHFVRKNDDELTIFSSHHLDEFSKEDIVAFNKVNDCLTNLEFQLIDKIQFQLDYLKGQLSDDKSWISDFELDLEIMFYLTESDPRYNDEIDNIIFQERHMLPSKSRGTYDAKEWFEYIEPYARCRFDEILDNRMCNLFRNIFYFSEFPEAEIQNIGMIWLDINVQPQIEIDFEVKSESVHGKVHNLK
jgi:hypothetical protein